MDTVAIWAQDQARVIGVNGHLPWYLPEDLQFFKKVTWGNIVLMGTKTYESLPQGSLPGRINIVLGTTYAHRQWELNFTHSSRDFCAHKPLCENTYSVHQLEAMRALEQFVYENYADFSYCTYRCDQAHQLYEVPDRLSSRFFTATLYFPTIKLWKQYQYKMRTLASTVYVIGGEQIFHAYLPYVRKIYVTQIAQQFSFAHTTDVRSYAPVVPTKYQPVWQEWKQSVSQLYYRHGTYYLVEK